MCSGSETGSYLRLIDCNKEEVIKKKKKRGGEDRVLKGLADQARGTYGSTMPRDMWWPTAVLCLGAYGGARPVHLIIMMIKWIRTSRLSRKYSLYQGSGGEDRVLEGLADQAKFLRPRDQWHKRPSEGYPRGRFGK